MFDVEREAAIGEDDKLSALAFWEHHAPRAEKQLLKATVDGKRKSG